MAKVDSENLAQTIRLFCEEHPKAQPAAVAHFLSNREGVEISARYVSQVMTRTRKKQQETSPREAIAQVYLEHRDWTVRQIAERASYLLGRQIKEGQAGRYMKELDQVDDEPLPDVSEAKKAATLVGGIQNALDEVEALRGNPVLEFILRSGSVTMAVKELEELAHQVKFKLKKKKKKKS